MSSGTSKRSFIYISSSSSEEVENEEEEFEDDDDDEDNKDDEAEDSGEEEEEEGSESTSCYEEEGSDDVYDEEEDEGLDDVACSKSVIRLLREGNDLRTLTLQQCKAYLRQHGLRIAGTKAVCLQRIKEHWRIKDGNGEAFYPRSSFAVNCTGDVCTGDVVLFKQKVYNKFEKVSRNGQLLGKRTVAGRVVKESYGAAKQQHTFTVEVLWSYGVKKLAPLFPLLIKGRNLYRLKTLRQPWKDEAARLRVLAEKHRRGAAARLFRERKKMKKTCSSSKEPQKQRRQTRPYQGKHAYGSGSGHKNPTGRGNLKQITSLKRPVDTLQRHHNPSFFDAARSPAFQSHAHHPSELWDSRVFFERERYPVFPSTPWAPLHQLPRDPRHYHW